MALHVKRLPSLFTTLSTLLFCIFLVIQRTSIKFSKDWPKCDHGGRQPKVVILVTSNAKNVELRKAQRQAFSDRFLWKEFLAKRFFLVAQDQNSTLMEEVVKEEDIILGDFWESYKHLSFKHLMGLSFTDACSNNSLIVKMDDDIAVDLTKIITKAIKDLIVENDENTPKIAGWVHSGMKVRRTNSKWALATNEFERDVYPDFVSGWTYAMTWKTAHGLVQEALKEREPLWIDDVWITGVLFEKIANSDFISWNQFFSPYVEMLNCCIDEGPFKLCDYWVFPSNSSTELIEDFGNHARFCYLEQGCMPRKEPLWKSCHLANPFFLPDSKGVGQVLDIS